MDILVGKKYRVEQSVNGFISNPASFLAGRLVTVLRLSLPGFVVIKAVDSPENKDGLKKEELALFYNEHMMSTSWIAFTMVEDKEVD